MNRDERFGPLAGRILISVIFLLSGFSKLSHWSASEGYLRSLHVPMVSLVLPLVIVIEIGGGVAVLLGVRTRLAALVMFLYLIPVTLKVHNFWTYQDGAMQNQMIHFLKNLAIMGGLLLLASNGAGKLSLDAARSKSK